MLAERLEAQIEGRRCEVNKQRGSPEIGSLKVSSPRTLESQVVNVFAPPALKVSSSPESSLRSDY